MTDIIQDHLEQLDASAETSRQYGFHSRADMFEESASTIRALLDRLEAAERGWQPIETAPHMREVLLWADTSVPPFDNWRMASGYFHSEMKVWVWGGEQVREWAFPPTHWRPLPDAPAIDAALVGEG
ncbi:hypothetical protein ACFSUK_29025 [Sphingobium scionense]|uniref:DUF551 domain-containing protein n=1 Tax=Sphingobium scionense TaxID=1404341 RepID=A0A7W6PWI5_9SPHN|nr:hypothetical protein [Sphingobium scionense]MBB4147945.1 hypothetical protein [Sphingobium scionense]